MEIISLVVCCWTATVSV